MEIELPEEVKNIFNKFRQNKYEIYIVGGAVRDLLTNKEVYDWDFTTNAVPEQILELFPDGFYDNQFGTVGIKATEEGTRPYEVTTFRTEHGYSDARRPDKVTWGKSLSDDLSRRDFTINALALDPTGTIIDSFHGQDDLKKKIIRAVGDPHERFSEDALRMMRAVRIAAQLGFVIEEQTLQAIKTNAPLINKIAKERIKDELTKILASVHPYEGMMMFKETGLMQEILPEMEKTFGVEQKSPGRHHIYDVGTHCMMALKHCPSENPIVRFAAMIHDIGKPQTYKKLANGTITFYNHEMVSTKIAKNIAERLRFSNKDTEKLVTLVRYHQFVVSEVQTDSAIRRFIKNIGVENITDMLDLRTADRLGSGSKITSWRLEEFKKRIIEVQKQPFSVTDLKIDGHDVMQTLNLKPGPKVGELLNNLFEEVVAQKLPNDRETLLTKLKSF